jgi:hypothetical protein
MAVEQDSMLRVPLDGSSKGDAFGVAAGYDEVL